MSKIYLNNVAVENIEVEQSSKSLDSIQLRMSDPEKELFIKYIEKSEKYLEFGSGGSTFLSLLHNNKIKVTSVENDSNWIKFLQEYQYIIEQEKNQRLYLHFEDTGAVGAWGVPIDIENSKHLFPNYSSQIFSKIDAINLDTILIDGRFRVACVLNTIKFCNKDVIIIIHDFWNRKYYHILLQFLNVIEEVDTLGVFNIKNNIDITKLELILHHHRYVFD